MFHDILERLTEHLREQSLSTRELEAAIEAFDVIHDRMERSPLFKWGPYKGDTVYEVAAKDLDYLREQHQEPVVLELLPAHFKAIHEELAAAGDPVGPLPDKFIRGLL